MTGPKAGQDGATGQFVKGNPGNEAIKKENASKVGERAAAFHRLTPAQQYKFVWENTAPNNTSGAERSLRAMLKAKPFDFEKRMLELIREEQIASAAAGTQAAGDEKPPPDAGAAKVLALIDRILSGN